MKRGVVGVRELKARMSAYLRAVAAGETILVGDRRKQPIAQLSPIVRSPDARHLDRLEGDGVLRRGQGRPLLRPPVKKRTQRSVAGMVIEDRR